MTVELCTLDGEKFEVFNKILSLFEKSECIVVTNSEIRQQMNTAYVFSNISSILGQDINLHIINPKKYIKMLKAFNKKVKVIKISEDNEKFIVSSNDTSIYCPKQIDKLAFKYSLDAFQNMKPIGDSIEIDKEVRKTINQLSSDAGFIDFIIHKSQIKGISIPETAVYRFDKYVDEDITENNCDFLLRVYSIFEIDGEKYSISLGLDEAKKEYWLYAKIDTGNLIIKVIENATKREDNFNLLL